MGQRGNCRLNAQLIWGQKARSQNGAKIGKGKRGREEREASRNQKVESYSGKLKVGTGDSYSPSLTASGPQGD